MKSGKFFKILFAIGIVVHTLYYLSAHTSGFLDPVFNNITKGQDFFQIPNGVYSFVNGASLQGFQEEPRFINCCGVNFNVYHPLFTLIIGGPLIFFSPWTAFGIWVGVHIILTILTLLVIFNYFSNHKYVYLASAFYLLSSYHYYEIKHAQYHALLSFFVLLTFVFIERKKDILVGIFYFLSLLVKPLGFLWLPVFVIYKKFRIAAIAMALFAVATIPISLTDWGSYYLLNLKSVVTHTRATYNIAALSEIFPVNSILFYNFGRLTAVVLLVHQFFKKPHILISISSWIFFQLIFYVLVFEYSYTILAVIIPILILTNQIRKSSLFWISATMLTLPTPAIYFHLKGVSQILPPFEYSLTALWSIWWLLLFWISLLFSQPAEKLSIDANSS